MRRVVIFLFLLPVLAIAQNKVVIPDWQVKDSLLSFSDASYLESTGTLPVYSKLFSWDVNYEPEITLEVRSSSPLTQSALPHINTGMLKSEPQVLEHIVFENGNSFVQVTVIPYFINQASGIIEKADEFSIDIEKIPAIAPLKEMGKGIFASKSELAEGDWYKIAVNASGIHKITYEQLSEIGIENPASARIYGAGAILLPEDYSKGSYDDIHELPVYVSKGSDQIFGPGDYLLFYARGPVSWNYDTSKEFFTQVVHDYALQGYYFVTDDRGAPSVQANAVTSTATADQNVTDFDLLNYYEEENINVLNSGREWYAKKFKISLSDAYPFTLPNIKKNENIKIQVIAAGRSNEKSSMEVKANGILLDSLKFETVNLSSSTTTFAREVTANFETPVSQESVIIQVDYNQPNSNSEAYLNSITVNARASLKMTGNELIFRDSRSVSPGGVSKFNISNFITGSRIWDITDPNEPLNVNFSQDGSTASFKMETSDLHEFIAFNPSGNFPSPEFVGRGLGKIENQDLHNSAAPDLLIVYGDNMEEQAGRLAEHRRNRDGLSVLTVEQGKVFNEFSSGTPNVAALRNYLKMYYDDPGSGVPRYLLLFGDGSYDNRDTISANPNILLTYQSVNSLEPTSSYVSDDFYGLLDTGEKIYDGLLDIGIGRLPASTADEAEVLVDKIIAYDSTATLGEWRNFICFIGDDEDGNLHMSQANILADYVEANYPQYNINKIFLDAYPQETTPTGDMYPDVTRAINDQINRGALIINYTGHGSILGLAHEKVVDLTNIKAWNNAGKLPLFMTATCEFSRYDEYIKSDEAEETSAGEEVILNPGGGGIALFTTTRLVYSGPNYVLNEKFYQRVFEKDSTGNYYRLGDIIKYSKNNTGPGINKRNFTLLGDPSTMLSFPRNIIVTDSINHMALDELTDTLSALDFVSVSGHLEDPEGSFLENLNGTVIPIVYDKEKNLRTLSNDGDREMEFKVRNSILYKGNVSVENGRFSFSFYVPKDISYNMGDGKISYYAADTITDAHGATSDFIIGGLGDFTDIDTSGPVINVYMNDTLFRNGGIVTSSPSLYFYVKDKYGINTTGNGIGHDITATLDDNRNNAIILNEYYVADQDSYTSGSVSYQYSDLPLGKHTIQVKVWDIFNNSATGSVEFLVVESLEMLLEEVYNYPNPFEDYTMFNVEHNRPDQELDIVIRIYDIRGNLVTVLQNHEVAGGYRLEPITWDGNGMGGATLGGGIYVYKILVKTADGEEATQSGRMILKR